MWVAPAKPLPPRPLPRRERAFRAESWERRRLRRVRGGGGRMPTCCGSIVYSAWQVVVLACGVTALFTNFWMAPQGGAQIAAPCDSAGLWVVRPAPPPSPPLSALFLLGLKARHGGRKGADQVASGEVQDLAGARAEPPPGPRTPRWRSLEPEAPPLPSLRAPSRPRGRLEAPPQLDRPRRQPAGDGGAPGLPPAPRAAPPAPPGARSSPHRRPLELREALEGSTGGAGSGLGGRLGPGARPRLRRSQPAPPRPVEPAPPPPRARATSRGRGGGDSRGPAGSSRTEAEPFGGAAAAGWLAAMRGA